MMQEPELKRCTAKRKAEPGKRQGIYLRVHRHQPGGREVLVLL